MPALTPMSREQGAPSANGAPSHGVAPTTGAIIACIDVHKAYHTGERDVPALCGVDFTIERPGFYGIMGASGSGKSTLLHLLAALDTPDRGTVIVAGRDLSRMSDRELTLFRRTQLGIVFQQFNLIPTLTAVENVELPGMLAGEEPARLRARSMELLTQLGLADRRDHKPDALSGGEQQRVAIARALLYRPKVVLADEPTGNLDSVNSRRLWSLLGDIARTAQVTIVMVTHEPTAAVNCERVLVMQDGQVRGHIDTEGLDASGLAARYQQFVAAT
jgi:putative ABC transport system ATP-binding protein